MLPACRKAEETLAIPQFALTRSDIDTFMDELREFHIAFRECFARQEPREQFFHYMVGQFSPLERKSIEPMALQVEGGKFRAMQRLVSDALWDEAAMLETYHRLVQDAMGEADGVLIIDETGFAKKGHDSVGVARQYCGSLGKVDIVRWACLRPCVTPGLCPRSQTAVPAGAVVLRCLPRPADQVQATRRGGMAEQTPIGCRDGPGTPPGGDTAVQVYCGRLPVRQQSRVLGRVRGLCGHRAFVATPADTRRWLQPLATTLHPYTYKGAQRTKRVAVTDTPPSTVAELAHAIPATFWYRRTVSEGTKGPITYEFARKRIMLCKEGQPTTAVWLLIKRTLGAHPRYWYYLSNAPMSAPLRLFVWLSGVRWAIEQCFEETKTEFGMDHYEVRKYPGWHHHMLTCMLAHFFLWHLHLGLKKKAPALTVSQVRRLLEVVLPLKVFQADEVLRYVAGMQQRQHRAYLSHRKRRLREILLK